MRAALAAVTAAWAALLVGRAWRWSHEPVAARLLDDRSAAPRQPADMVTAIGDVVGELGRLARRLLARARGRSPEPPRARLAELSAGWAIAGAAVGAVIWPGLALVGAAAGWGAPVAVDRRRAAARRDAIADDLPDVVDLLLLAATAGLTPALAVEAVGRRSAGPVADGLASAHRRASGGAALADSLDEMARQMGDVVRLSSPCSWPANGTAHLCFPASSGSVPRCASSVSAGPRRRRVASPSGSCSPSSAASCRPSRC